MVVTKMKQAKIKCRECNCWLLTCDIIKKRRGYKTLIHTLTNRIEGKTNDDDNNNNNNINNKNNKYIYIYIYMYMYIYIFVLALIHT